jgi:DNA polymerase-3 subunit beta
VRLTCDRQELAEAVGLAASIVPTRSTKPILQNIAIRAGEDGVEVLATDLEVGLRVKVEKADVERRGAALLPSQKALSILREIEGDRLELVCEDRVSTISAGGSRFRMVGEDPAEFPDVPGAGAREAIHFGRTQLEGMIRKTAFAAATEGARYALNGVLFDLRGDRLRLVATDGKRLALAERPVELATAQTFARVVPTRGVSLLARIAHPDDPTLAMSFGETSLFAWSTRAVLSAQLLQGHFPPYEEVIPKEHDKKVELETAAFQAAIRRAALLTAKDSQAVRLSFGYNKLTLSSRTPDVGESTIEIPVVYPYEPIEIGFNPQYVIDALKVIDGERFTLELRDETSPGLIREGEGFLYVVMPINIV